jgi:hypothetical protein
MSRVSSNAARYNKIKSRKNVQRAKMRVLRAELMTRKPAAAPGPEASKA